MCPNIVDIFYKTPEHKFPRLIFTNSVSEEALLAFADYIYNGVLNLDPDLLSQMKLIAMPLEMKALEQLCINHLRSLLPPNISSPPVEPMSSGPCSSFGHFNEAASECNQAPVFEMSPPSNEVHPNDILTVDSNAATDNICDINISLIKVEKQEPRDQQ